MRPRDTAVRFELVGQIDVEEPAAVTSRTLTAFGAPYARGRAHRGIADPAAARASRGLRRDITDVFASAGGRNDYLRAREVSYPFGESRGLLPRFQHPSLA